MPAPLGRAAQHGPGRTAKSTPFTTVDLELQITAVITAHAPQLLQRHGIGPDSAAALLITAGDNRDRMNSEASFAALCAPGGLNPRSM